MGKNANQLLKLAESYLGQGGSTFRKYCGLGAGDPWCCAFVRYIFDKGGDSKLFYNGKNVTYCPSAITWCRANLAEVPLYLALPSDIIFFDWQPNGVPDHIGFVRERDTAVTIKTIEGNTSGGIVANKTRVSAYVLGVFRPEFTAKFDVTTALEIDGFFGYNSIAMLQTALKKLGFYKHDIDAIMGKNTVKALQKWAGVAQDGAWGARTSKAVQKKLGIKADGLFGPDSAKALQKWANKTAGFTTAGSTAETNDSGSGKTPENGGSASTETEKKAYTGELPKLRVKRNSQEVIDATLKWAKKIASNNTFHYGHGKDSHHNGCYFCGTQPKSKRNAGIKEWEFTYCCNPFAHAAWSHGGLVPVMLKKCHNGSSYGFSTNEGYAKSSLFKAKGKLSAKNLEPGDVLCSSSHVAIYAGNGKVLQAGHEDDNKIGSDSWNSSISLSKWGGYTRVYRFIGKVDANIAIQFGEYSDRVKLLQKFLNWYYGKKVLANDGFFGEETRKYVKKFQKANGLADDGKAGKATLAKIKEIAKSGK